VFTPILLQPLPISYASFTDISMDFIEGLPKSDGKEVIYMVVDRFNKYAYLLALSLPYFAIIVVKIFLDNVYKLYGSLITIVID